VREILLHDTRSGRSVPLRPRSGRRVGIYACGPTVYGPVHVGNARPFVVFSLLARFLRHEGLEPRLVINVTDVNDKIYDAAQAAGVASERLAREMTERYVAETDELGLGRPDAEPLASQTIPAIVALVEELVARGHAYPAEGDVYFDVRSFPGYGSLSHRDVEAMDQGEGVEGAARKRDPLDFALWKATKPGEDTSWESRWGPGRPGWHIECSAMAETLLGVGFEVHGGGSDLVFPHHENEAAQTEAARGSPLAAIWMHNGMVRAEEKASESKEKMSKSLGNVFLLGEALAAWGRDPLIMYLCGAHYRKPIDYSERALREAGRRVDRVREVARRLAAGASPAALAPLRERFFAALADDFNTAEALNGAVFPWIREVNARLDAGEVVGSEDLETMLDVLGLVGIVRVKDGTESGAAQAADPGVRALVARREQARAARDFVLADHLRDELAARGWTVRDGPEGPSLVAR